MTLMVKNDKCIVVTLTDKVNVAIIVDGVARKSECRSVKVGMRGVCEIRMTMSRPNPNR